MLQIVYNVNLTSLFTPPNQKNLCWYEEGETTLGYSDVILTFIL